MDISTRVPQPYFLAKKSWPADESSNSERELQVQIPWQCTLALLGKNMLHSTAHLLHRYGLLSFYWMFTPQGIGFHPVKVQVTSSPAQLLLLLLFHHSSHLPPNLDNISITLQVWSKHQHLNVSTGAGFVFSGTEVVFTQHKKKGAKSNTSLFSLFSVAFAQFVLQYQGCNAINLNPSLYTELDVILMQRSNFDNYYHVIYLVRIKIALFFPQLQQVQKDVLCG